MTIARDSRIGRGYIAREGDTGSVVWASSRDALSIYKGASRVSLTAKPGQLVFNLSGTEVVSPGANAYPVSLTIDYGITYILSTLSGAPNYAPGIVTLPYISTTGGSRLYRVVTNLGSFSKEQNVQWNPSTGVGSAWASNFRNVDPATTTMWVYWPTFNSLASPVGIYSGGYTTSAVDGGATIPLTVSVINVNY